MIYISNFSIKTFCLINFNIVFFFFEWKDILEYALLVRSLYLLYLKYITVKYKDGIKIRILRYVFFLIIWKETENILRSMIKLKGITLWNLKN